MSMGLVAFSGGQIHLAVESMGVPECGLDSKIQVLQQDPRMALVFTGYLDVWTFALGQYQPSKSLEEAAHQLKGHLEACQAPGEGAYGRLCGYEAEKPVVYRVDWERGQGTSITRIELGEGQVEIIGDIFHAKPAGEEARKSLQRGMDPERALRSAIDAEIPRANPKILRGPVHYTVI